MQVTAYFKHNHSRSASKKRMSANCKAFIIRKLTDGFTNSQVLRFVREQFPFGSRDFCTVSRQIKDLRRYHCPPPERMHASDSISVMSMIQAAAQSDDNYVLSYKQSGEHRHGFEDTDFFLGIVTNQQCRALRLLGSRLICVDSTHNISKYNFKLLTVICIGPHDQGIPVAFLITNNERSCVE